MTDKKNGDGGYDETTHHLIALHEPPDSLSELRKELAFHPDISSYAQEGLTFEDCLGRIALKLDIVLDGDYEVGPLCEVLVTALRARKSHTTAPHLRHSSLIDVELVEKEGEMEIVERDRAVQTVVPTGSVVKEVKH
jgi:hypothetical protein